MSIAPASVLSASRAPSVWPLTLTLPRATCTYPCDRGQGMRRALGSVEQPGVDARIWWMVNEPRRRRAKPPGAAAALFFGVKRFARTRAQCTVTSARSRLEECAVDAGFLVVDSLCRTPRPALILCTFRDDGSAGAHGILVSERSLST